MCVIVVLLIAAFYVVARRRREETVALHRRSGFAMTLRQINSNSLCTPVWRTILSEHWQDD